MEYLMAIALLCNVTPSTGGSGFVLNTYTPSEVDRFQLDCQQRYLQCVRTGPKDATKEYKLEQCIMGKK